MLVTNQNDLTEILQKVATAINVQLTFDDVQRLPLIAPNGFDTAKRHDKLFLYGPSGCGKSRCIFEFIKDKLSNIKNIFIINPRQTIGEESGRIKIHELVSKFDQNDIVVWDNFPDDLVKRDVESGRKALEIVSSKDVKILLVALKPKYLEVYRDVASKTPELYGYEIAYNREKIKGVIMSYGKNIIQFTDLYEKHILPNIDKVSTTLWQREPLPISILAYYKELINKQADTREQDGQSQLNAILEAEKLLLRTEFYEHQFTLISSLEERQSDIEFLYILKLCYELGLNRNPARIEQLQKGIFDSVSPKEPSRKLSTWVYLSGQYYAMHDTPGESVQFTEGIKLKIMRHLTDNFLNVIPKEDNQVYLFGIFFGRNIHLITRDTQYNFLPDHIYNYMKGKRYFEAGLGQGTGEVFASLDETLQAEILRRVNVDREFARGLGDGLGNNLQSLDKKKRTDVLEWIRKSIPVARGLGESLGRNFKNLPKEVQEEAFEILSTEENVQFARGLGTGLGRIFIELDRRSSGKNN